MCDSNYDWLWRNGEQTGLSSLIEACQISPSTSEETWSEIQCLPVSFLARAGGNHPGLVSSQKWIWSMYSSVKTMLFSSFSGRCKPAIVRAWYLRRCCPLRASAASSARWSRLAGVVKVAGAVSRALLWMARAVRIDGAGTRHATPHRVATYRIAVRHIVN